MGKAREAGLVSYSFHNPREHGAGARGTVDDYPYGGGPGMVMQLDPLVKTVRAVDYPGRILLMAATGRPFTHDMAQELSGEENITIICGRYEGIDARLEQLFPLEMISAGQMVINGGEAAAMLVIEALTRLLPNFMGKCASADDESHARGLLEYPHYTRPENYEGLTVPPVLTSGDHARIAAWRREQSLLSTLKYQPQLLDDAPLCAQDMNFLQNTPQERLGRNLHIALIHHPVMLDAKKSGTSSLTNLDIHDIARCSRSYGLAECHMVTPLADQQRLLQTLIGFWTDGPGGQANTDRAEALSIVRSSASLREVADRIESQAGQRPLLIATSAHPDNAGGKNSLGGAALRDLLAYQPMVLVFGTAQGLAQEALDMCDHMARPLRFMDKYNHLPVRSAVAIMLDRILGDRY
jgi:tRNA (guanine37-N1)-methyltransferase